MSTTTLRSSSKRAKALIPLASALIVAGVFSSPLHAQQLIAPTAAVASYSQSFLSAMQAQHEFSFPAATSPLMDTTGANSASGDQGKFFFLSASLSSDPVVRSVTVRSDQTLVFSPITILYWADAVFDTEAKMRADAIKVLGVVSNLSVKVDGVDAQLPFGVSSLQDFRQSGPLFPFVLVPGNITGYAPGVFPAITEGYTFAMEGLPLGAHTLRFTALMTSGYGFTFSQDITYNISSVPETSTWAMMSLGMAAIGVGALRRRRSQALDQGSDQPRD